MAWLTIFTAELKGISCWVSVILLQSNPRRLLLWEKTSARVHESPVLARDRVTSVLLRRAPFRLSPGVFRVWIRQGARFMNMRPLAKRCLQCGLLHCFWQIHLWLLSIYFVSEGVVFKEHFFKICTCRFIYLGGQPWSWKREKASTRLGEQLQLSLEWRRAADSATRRRWSWWWNRSGIFLTRFYMLNIAL